MRRVLPLKIALVSLLIAACVTINVYFPAAAADKAADWCHQRRDPGAHRGGGSNPPTAVVFRMRPADCCRPPRCPSVTSLMNWSAALSAAAAGK